MAKHFKLKFTIPSFQLCRSKDLSSFPGNPVVPAIYRLSPVNPKTHDIGHPNLLVPKPSKLVSLGHGCQMCRDRHDKQVKTRGRKSTSRVLSRRSNDLTLDHKLNCCHDEDDESQTLISCTTSFSEELCREETTVPCSHKPGKKLVCKHKRERSSEKKVQSMRFQTSDSLREKEKEHVKKTKTKRVVSTNKRNTVEGKVKESFAVVKKSKDPHQDFKKAMIEMIKEMEMSEAEDFEQLLQCFLALNSRSYHEVIVRAFMEIWRQMFILKPAASTENLQTEVESAAADDTKL